MEHKVGNALLFQRPSILICTSEIPASFAVVAAPIQKLWVLYCASSIPACLNVLEIRAANLLHFKNDPSDRINGGQALAPLSAK